MFEREAPYSPPKPMAKEAPTLKSATPKPDTNANREGYKQTKLGWIPEEWNIIQLSKYFKIANGQVDPKKEPYKKMPLIAPNHVESNTGIVLEKVTAGAQQAISGKYLFDAGDVIYSKIRPYLNKAFIADEPGLCSADMYPFKPLSDLNNRFLLAVLLNSRFLNFARSVSYRTGIPKINRDELDDYLHPLPPLPEQRAIADCLSTWDQAIQTLTQLITQKELRKKWLMQQLLTGKKRLPGFGGEWKEITLDKISERVTQKNEELNDNVVTISAQRGFVRQEDFFNKRVASDTLVGYYLVHRGEFAYNKSYSNGYPMGAFKRLDDFDKAVVTTLYICFKLKPNTDSDFAKYFFDGGRMNQNLMRIAQEGGRAHGLLNIGLSDFFGLKLVIPTKEEQTAIAQILQRADQEISLLNQKLTHLQNQKKGLMQQLLTGNKRLNLNNKQNGKK